MNQNYDINWLVDSLDKGQATKFLFFWGHTNKLNKETGKFCFSQWFELPFIVDGTIYKTAEHWMMANKALLFGDTKTYYKIINADKPGEAKELGRQVLGFDELIWNTNRYSIVVNGNIHKFNQHPKFADYLIESDDRILVEASPIDTIWGIGLSQESEHINDPYNWRGLSLLGFALMEVRHFLKTHGHFSDLKDMADLPWKVYPNVDPLDMFWCMGKGEDIIAAFSKYYSKLSDRDQMILRLTNPAPYKMEKFL